VAKETADSTWSNPIKVNQTKSNLSEGEIGRNWTRRCRKRAAEHRMAKPHQTGSSPGFVPRNRVTDRRRRNKLGAARCAGSQNKLGAARFAGCLALPSQVKPSQTQSNPVKPSQTQSNQIKPNQTCPREKLAEIGLCCDERDGGTSHGQTPSNRVKPRFCSKKSSYGWTETEQIKSGPLCGLSRPTVSSQTQSNHNRSFQPVAPACQA
jgi:hypothetical protein